MASQPPIPTKFCTSCGTQIHAMAEICPACGVRQMAPPAVYGPPPGYPWVPGGKDKSTAGILAILLGGVGAHKFYLGKVGQGILYLLFCWTFLPAIAGFIEGILYLTMSQERFDLTVDGGYRGGMYPG